MHFVLFEIFSLHSRSDMVWNDTSQIHFAFHFCRIQWLIDTWKSLSLTAKTECTYFTENERRSEKYEKFFEEINIKKKKWLGKDRRMREIRDTHTLWVRSYDFIRSFIFSLSSLANEWKQWMNAKKKKKKRIRKRNVFFFFTTNEIE